MPAAVEGALQMHADDGIELLLAEIEDHPVAQDAGVVDQNVEPTKLLDRGAHDGLGCAEVGHAVVVRDRLTTSTTDGSDGFIRGRCITPAAVNTAAKIVHHDRGSFRSQ